MVQSLPAFLITALKESPGAYLAGGSLRALYDNCGTRDYDVYFRGQEALDKFVKVAQGSNPQITLTNGVTEIYAYGHKIQATWFDYFETKEALVDRFDMTCNQFALEYVVLKKSEQLPGPFARHTPAPVCEWQYLDLGKEDATVRIIKFHKPYLLKETMERVNRFLGYGYTIQDAEYQKLLDIIKNSDNFYASTVASLNANPKKILFANDEVMPFLQGLKPDPISPGLAEYRRRAGILFGENESHIPPKNMLME